MLFTVSFDANNGTGMIPPQGFVKNIAAALTANTFTRTYYTFTSWNTSANGSGTSYQDGESVSLTESMRLYAQWRANTFALEYELNGAADPGNPTGYTVENTVTLVNPEKAGYAFTGWTGTDLTGTTESVTIPAGSTGNRSYTANFTPIIYNISYDLDGGTNDSSNPATYTIESATITLNAPTREGYTFIGWLLDGETVTEIATGSIGYKSLVASWQAIAPVMSSTTYSLTAKEGQPANLTISGTPEAGTAGTYSVSVTAANEGGSANADVVITVDTESKDVESKDITSRDVKRDEPVTTVTEDGASTTRTTTTLTDTEGNVLLATLMCLSIFTVPVTINTRT